LPDKLERVESTLVGSPLLPVSRTSVERPEVNRPVAPQTGAAPITQEPPETAPLGCSTVEIQQSVFAKIKAAWGTQEGGEGYDAAIDFNADGAINILDYQVFLKFLQTDFEALKASWGSASGQDKYNAGSDYNSDGKINILDYQKFIQKWVA
jgi:hypothetical protein